jgi:MerR family transcriptional regulator/heat shock protein HspR
VRISIAVYLQSVVGPTDLYRRCDIFYTSGSVAVQADGRGIFEEPMMAGGHPARGVYAISVAAELTGTAVQNLRVYERHGLVEPARTGGGTRRYSEDDLDRIRRVLALLAEGLNLAGIALVLDLQDDLARLRATSDGPADDPANAS